MKKNIHLLLVIFFIFVFFLYFSFLSIRRVETLNSHYYDMGIMNQVVYNTAKGRFLEMTNATFLKNMSRLAIHFDPILILFSPFYLISPSYKWLLVFQALIVALGSLAVFLLTSLLTSSKNMALFFSLIYLLNYQIGRAIIFDFHPVVLATTFLLWACYFYHKKKFNYYYLFLFLSLLTKEHVGLFIFFLGLFYLFNFKDKRNGLITIFLGLTFFLLTNFFLIPYFRQEEHFAFNYYKNIKNSINILEGERLSYLKRIYLPFFYSFLTPAVFLSLPELLINLLSKNKNMISYYFHYQSLILAGLFYGLVLGYKNFNQIVKNNLIKKIVFGIFLISNMYYFYQFYPLPFLVKEKAIYRDINFLTKKAILIWQKTLKDEKIKVATTPKLAPFFSSRKFYANFLFDPAFYNLGYSDEEIFGLKKDSFKMVDYVVIYKKEIGDITKENAIKKLYNNFLQNKSFQLVFDQAEIEVYKKN
ncbi:MAG: DUF2079 domain-containing protein [Microgenomates group bacterium]